MTFAHPLALTLLVLLVPLAVLATRAKVPIHGTQRTLAFALLGLAWAALVLALADPLVSRSPRTTRVVVLASAKELTSAARERAEREAAAWRDRVPHADPFLVREAGADLAGACKTAMAEIPAGTPGELLVLGPARGFRSNLAPILQLATARNIVVHARESTASSALRLLEVRHASAAREHEPVRWIATIESSEVRTAKLEVWQGQDRLASRDLKLTPGVSLHQLEVTPRGGGVVILTTTVVGPDSTDAVHCTERSALLVEGRPTVLHLATDPRRSAALAATLAPFGLDVTPANPGALDEASVDSAQVLIVDDVPQSLWSEALQQKVKDRVERQGLGLLVAGARAGAATGGYAKSPWSGLLPIEPSAREERRDPSVGLVIVLDTSGSMGGLRIELAKEVARLALRRLLPHDKAGIVEFYGSRRWAAPLQPAANAIELQRALDRLQAGGGTIIYSALEESFYALLTAKTRYKHVLVLTDGGVESGPFETLARRMADAGMQVHTVLIGPQGNSPFLQSLAQWGRGRFYSCPSRFELPELRFLEPENAPLSSLREGNLPVTRENPVEATLAFTGDTLPGISAWNDSNLRDGAATLLRGAAGEPVLAGWDQGQGRVLALATDLLGQGERLQQDARYGAFLADTLRSLLRRGTSQQRDLELLACADRLCIEVRGDSARAAVTARVESGTAVRTLLLLGDPASVRRAEIPWTAAPVGSSAFVVDVDCQGTHLRGAACAPAAPELRGGDVSSHLLTIATASGGTTQGPIPMATQSARKLPRSVAAWCALLALLAFLAAILARRWPGWPTSRGTNLGAASLWILVLLGATSAGRAQETAPSNQDAARIQSELAQQGSLDELLRRTDLSRSLRANALRSEGRLAAAMEGLDAKDADQQLERALLLEALGKPEEARAIYTEALQRKDLAPQERAGFTLRRAELALHAGDPAAAESDLRAALAMTTDTAARTRIAVLAAGYRRFDLALELLPAERATTAALCMLRARWCEAAGHEPEAFAAWEHAAEVCTLEREKRFALVAALEVRRRAGTLATLAEAWRTSKDRIRQSLRIQVLRELGRADEAFAAIQTETESVEDLREILLLAAEAKRTGQADALVDARLAKRPNDLETLRAYAIALVDRGEVAKAEAAVLAAVPTASTRGLQALAEVARELALEGAFRTCVTTLAEKGSSQERLEALMLEVTAARAAKKADSAIALLLAARERFNAPAERARIAEQLESIGRRDEAMALWREVYTTTKAEDVGLHVAWLLAESQDPKQRTEAIGIYEKVWLSAGAEARRRDAQSRVLDTAAREGTLADLAVRLEQELANPAAEQRETKRQALLEIFARAKDSAGAEAVLAKELSDPARVVDAKLALARVLVECGELGRYAKTLAELRKLDPANELEYTQQQAYAALERGRPAEARSLVRELLARPGVLPESARELAAGVLALSGKPKEAVATYRKALAHHPERIETWLLLGGALQKAGRTNDAHGMFCNLLLEEPPDDLLLVAIDGLLNLDAPAPLLRFAERTLRRRIASKPDKVYLLRALQDVLEELKDEAGRIQALADTLLVAGEQRASFVRELIEESRTKADKAGQARYARLLLAIGDEVPPSVLVEAGQSLLAARDFASAERAFERARQSTELSAVEDRIVAAYDGVGRQLEAERILRRALRRDPDNVEKTIELSKLLERRGGSAEALAIAQRLAIGLLPGGLRAPAATPERGVRRAGVVLPTVNRNQEKDKPDQSYEDLRTLALRCAKDATDLEGLVAALEQIGRTDKTRTVAASVEIRLLANAFADARLRARAASLEEAVLTASPTPADRKAIVSARLASGSLASAKAALEPNAAAFDRDRFQIEMLGGDLEKARDLARTANPNERASAALALYVSGADELAKSLVAEAPTQTRPRRAAASPLTRLQRVFGIAVAKDVDFQARLDELAALPTPIARVAQTAAFLRTATQIPAEKRAAVLRELLPLFSDDSVARLSATFFEAAKGVLPASELGPIAKRTLLASSTRFLGSTALAPLEYVPRDERAEVLDKVLEKVPAEERDGQILLALMQADGLAAETRRSLIGRLSGKPLAMTGKVWLIQLATEPKLQPEVAAELVAKLPDSKDAVRFLLRAIAAGTPAQAQELADQGLAVLATVDSLDGQPWRSAERLIALASQATRQRIAADPTDTRVGARIVRATALASVGREMDGLAELMAAFRTRSGEASLLNLVTTRAAQLGATEDAFAALKGFVAQSAAVYSFQATSLANQLLDRGAAEEALGVLRRVEMGAPPLRTELRAIAALPDADRRAAEGRRLLQDQKSATLRMFLPNDPAQAPPSLDEALAKPRYALVPRTLLDCARSASDWAALAFHPEGGALAEARLRMLSPSERLEALDLARARLRACGPASSRAQLLASAELRLAEDPLAPDALALLVSDRFETSLAGTASRPTTASTTSDPLLRRYALLASLREPPSWARLAEIALVADDNQDHDLATRVGKLLVSDRDALASPELRALLPELLLRFAPRPEQWLELAPAGSQVVPDLDAVLLRFLVASDIEPDRLKAAFAGVEEHVTRNRFRLEGLLLPWLGLHLRAGDPGSVEALLDRLTAGSEGFDNSAAQAWAAAVPRLATWKDQGLAAKLSERLLAAIDSPSFGSRMTSMRLLGMLAHRYAEAGQPEQAKLLRDRLATRFANVPSAASWIRGPS